jgi:hypothetical protein
MNQNIPLEKAIEKYFQHKSWATPKELVNELSPLYPYYPEDTLRRLIHRALNKNYQIVQHPIKPFYVHKESLDWFNFFISIESRSNRLNVLYNEGFTVPYKGEISFTIPGHNHVLNGEIIITPNPTISNPASKRKHYLMIMKKI